MKGIGVLLNELTADNDTRNAVLECVGKTIRSIKQPGNSLLVVLDEDLRLELFDDGQSCCENRYMQCDDDLSKFKGAKFQGIEIKDGPTSNVGEWGDEKECQFLIVHTDKGEFTVANYNEHNGYYGGFSIKARLDN